MGPDGRLVGASHQLLSYSSVEGLVGSGLGDHLYVTEAISFIDGGKGDDFIFVTHGVGKTVLAGDGNDRITSRTDNNTISGGTGNDRLYSFGNFASVDGGSGDDRVTVTGSFSSVHDSEGNDTYAFTGTYGLTADFTGARGNNIIYDFNPSVQRFFLSDMQIASSSVSQVVDASGVVSLSIVGDDFSVLLVGVQQLPSAYFQSGVLERF